MNIRTQLKSIGSAALYPTTCALLGTGLLLEFRMDQGGPGFDPAPSGAWRIPPAEG
jgi:hypothetical protein